MVEYAIERVSSARDFGSRGEHGLAPQRMEYLGEKDRLVGFAAR
jgi:hypothetical protein